MPKLPKSDSPVVVRVPKSRRRSWKNIKLSDTIIFISFALVAAGGYVVGIYNTQIMAAVGPVFGYKPHAATLDLSSLQTIYSNLAANFDGTLDTNTLIDGAKHGLVAAAGDTYTLYMNKQEATTFNNSLSGNVGGGIGVAIAMKNNQVVINQVLPGNPAIAAGVQAGDIVTAINGQSTVTWTADQVVAKLRGDVGTTLKLTVLRGTTSINFNLTRATINDPSVTSSIDGTLGIITITRFDSDTGDLARSVAQNFVSKGVKKVILDLRDNGGGYVSSAQQVASLWLNDQVIVTERSGNVVTDTLSSGSNPLLAGLPTIVLVNGDSASASEIVAGALQDYGVAKLVGEQTYGKGSVQKIISFNDGSQLKVTVAKWYTPKGKNINKQGITPNIVVDYTQADVNAGIDPQLNAAKTALGV